MVETTLRESCIPFRKPKNNVRAIIARIMGGMTLCPSPLFYTYAGPFLWGRGAGREMQNDEGGMMNFMFRI